MSTPLSAYEIERLKNIERNQAVLAQLGLEALAPPKPTVVRKPKVQRPPTEPSRKSGRIAALPAPSVFIDAEHSNGKVVLGGVDAAAEKTEEEAASAAAPLDEDPAPASEAELFPNEALVYGLLRDEKNRIARENDCAAYHVAQNRALMAMVRCVPRSVEALLSCWGWGEAKARSHGARLLATLEPHAAALREARRGRAADRQEAAGATEAAGEAAGAEGEEEVLEVEDDLPKTRDDLRPQELPAYEAMLAWKRARAKELGYNDPYIICHKFCSSSHAPASRAPGNQASWLPPL